MHADNVEGACKTKTHYEAKLLTVILWLAEENSAGSWMVRWIVLHVQLCQNTKRMLVTVQTDSNSSWTSDGLR